MYFFSNQNFRKPRYGGLFREMTRSNEIPYLQNDAYLFVSTLNATSIFLTLSVIWFHLNNSKNVKNTHGAAIVLKLTHRTFPRFEIIQMVPNRAKHHV